MEFRGVGVDIQEVRGVRSWSWFAYYPTPKPCMITESGKNLYNITKINLLPKYLLNIYESKFININCENQEFHSLRSRFMLTNKNSRVVKRCDIRSLSGLREVAHREASTVIDG